MTSSLGAADIYWYLAQPDGARPWLAQGSRSLTFRDHSRLARTADRAGFAGMLLAAGRGRLDPWVAASSLAAVTSRLQMLIAQYPGVCSARNLVDRIQSFRSLFPRRIALNLVMGDRASLRPHGLDLEHDQRYALAHSFWRECCSLARADGLPFSHNDPIVMTGGGSESSMVFAAEHADVWLGLGVPPPEFAASVARVRDLAAERGRAVRCGVRLNLILRETNEAAWIEAERTYAELQSANTSVTNHGDRVSSGVLRDRVQALIEDGGNARSVELHPGLWGGYQLFRSGPVTAAVGGADEVERLLREYRVAGAELFILGGYPHLEEARRFARFIAQLSNGACAHASS